MSDVLTTEEIYGVRFYIEMAMNEEERYRTLANALTLSASKSDLVSPEISTYELSLVATAFLKEMALSPEEISRKVADRLEFAEGQYRAGLAKNLSPKMGEVAQIYQSVRKVRRALERWNDIDPSVAEPGILPQIGDDFAYQVEKELVDESLVREVAALKKILFHLTSPEKQSVTLDSGLRAVVFKSEDTGDMALHEDTLDLWMEDFGIEETHRDYAAQQLGLLSEAFSEHVENYRALSRIQRKRENSYSLQNRNMY